MGLGDEYSGGIRKKGRGGLRPFLPAIGFILALAAGAISWVLSEPAVALLRDNIAGIPDDIAVQVVVGAAIFALLITVFAALYSAFQPKQPKGVSERDLDKEKRERAAEEAAMKRRKKEMRDKMRQRNKR